MRIHPAGAALGVVACSAFLTSVESSTESIVYTKAFPKFTLMGLDGRRMPVEADDGVTSTCPAADATYRRHDTEWSALV